MCRVHEREDEGEYEAEHEKENEKGHARARALLLRVHLLGPHVLILGRHQETLVVAAFHD
jgi:hypothetical protein